MGTLVLKGRIQNKSSSQISYIFWPNVVIVKLATRKERQI